MSKIKTPLIVVVIGVALFASFKVFISSGGGVGIEVEYAGLPGGCTNENPIHVTITNRLPLSMYSYSFELWANREGYSRIVRHDLHPRESDKIIPAFGTESLCWSLPKIDLMDLYLKYGGSVAAATEDQNKESSSLKWAGEIKSAYWDLGVSFRKL